MGSRVERVDRERGRAEEGNREIGMLAATNLGVIIKLHFTNTPLSKSAGPFYRRSTVYDCWMRTRSLTKNLYTLLHVLHGETNHGIH